MRTHLERLVGLEYVLVHRGGRGQSFVYELLYDGGGADGRPHLVGLVDVAELAETPAPVATTAEFEPPEGEFEGPTGPQRAPNGPDPRSPGTSPGPAVMRKINGAGARNAHLGNSSGSHVAVGAS